jgi:hypothetical protein
MNLPEIHEQTQISEYLLYLFAECPLYQLSLSAITSFS